MHGCRIMLKLIQSCKNKHQACRGVTTVEFAIISILFFILLFGILEFGRLFYVFNTVQEVTRRAAREAVVSWAPDNENSIKRLALFGSNALPAGAEITLDKIDIQYLNKAGGTVSKGSVPNGATDNIEKCLAGSPYCIAYVKVSITDVTYAPMVSLFPFLAVPIPASTVIMPAESMGYAR